MERAGGLAKSLEPNDDELLSILRENESKGKCFFYDRIVVGFDPMRILFVESDPSSFSS